MKKFLAVLGCMFVISGCTKDGRIDVNEVANCLWKGCEHGAAIGLNTDSKQEKEVKKR